MKSIFKYPLEITDEQEVMMPKWCTPLSVQMQNGQLVMWALVDTEQPIVRAYVRVYGTGNPLPDEFYANREYNHFVGTFQHGQFVGHVFIAGTFIHQS
jgi:hypothetical protein